MHIVSFTRSMCLIKVKVKVHIIIMLTSENTAGSTNTAAENNCNSFILDNNRLSSCRYEIYEPITMATPPSWVGDCSVIVAQQTHFFMSGESWVSYYWDSTCMSKKIDFLI